MWAAYKRMGFSEEEAELMDSFERGELFHSGLDKYDGARKSFLAGLKRVNKKLLDKNAALEDQLRREREYFTKCFELNPQWAIDAKWPDQPSALVLATRYRDIARRMVRELKEMRRAQRRAGMQVSFKRRGRARRRSS